MLVLIAISYALCAMQTAPNPSGVAFLVQLATVAVILWVADVKPRLRLAGWIVLAAAGVATAVATLAGATGYFLDVVLAAASALAYLVAPIAIIAHIVRRDRVDGQALLASIAAYILVGMFFTFVYTFIALVSSEATFGPDQPDSLTTQLFFSFTTLTTTGYGNVVPVGAGVQSVAIVEAITGQLFLVIAVARVVSGWTRPENRRGITDQDRAG